MPYTSLEQKSERERYIRVAAIVMVISEGIMNICVSRTRKKIVFSAICHHRHRNKQRRTPSNESELKRMVNILCSLIERERITIQVQRNEYLTRQISEEQRVVERYLLGVPLVGAQRQSQLRAK
jgi:hypothetical protein